MNVFVKCSGILLLSAALASAICSKGCPDTPSIIPTFIKIPSLLYINALSIADPILPVTTVNCTEAFFAFGSDNNPRSEPIISIAQLISYRNTTTQRYDSMYWTYDINIVNQIANISTNVNGISPFQAYVKIPYYKNPYIVGLACYPQNPDDTETCDYVWTIFGTSPEIDEQSKTEILEQLKKYGVESNGKYTAFYSQQGCTGET